MSEQNQTGMIIRGADGKMYYVTDEDLAPHQLSEEQAAELQKMFDVDSSLVHVIDETELQKIGLRASSSVIVMVVSVAALRKWRNRG
ncbi:MAG: hypothetical protein H6673_14335 [Anaerolineales bacterium]|nr:hypothetical protein [Anaerolineales bacterium]